VTTTAVTTTAAATAGAREPRGHVAEFDGLRGYLAWWVVGFHLYQSTGLAALNIKPLALTLGQGWGAVPIFFILSGLVIAMTTDARREPYATFIVRRLFRLAPVYYLVLAVATADAWRSGAYGEALWAHVALHATMLHGLVPDQVLPGAAVALEYVAWSITVEWQFYLLAPVVLGLVRASPTRALGLMALFGAAGYALGKSRLTFAESSVVVLRAGLFAVGIASYAFFRYAMAHREGARGLVAYMLPVGLALAWVCGGPPIWPGPIWVVIFSAVLTYHAGVESPVTRPVRALLGLPFVVWLGQISYSTYLCHDRVLMLVDGALARWPYPLSAAERGVALVAVGVPMILAASAALYYLVERPGIGLGKRLAARLDRRGGRSDA
jgi:peptidoglycan/LPS O-acetylase OafA/YrhL